MTTVVGATIGPEMVKAWERELSASYKRSRAISAEAGDQWAALGFGREWLFFSWDARFYGLSRISPSDLKEIKGWAKKVPPIKEALKCHIAGYALEDIEQIGDDRVLKFSFRRSLGAGAASTRALVLEATGKFSNLLILDESDRIVECARHVHRDENRYRSLLPGLPYKVPPPFDGVTLEEVALTRENLSRLKGLGPGLLRHIETHWELYSPEEWRALISSLLDEGWNPSFVVQKINNYLAVFPKLLPEARAIAGSPLSACRETTFLPTLASYVGEAKLCVRKAMLSKVKLLRNKLQGVERVIQSTHMASRWSYWGEILLAYADSVSPGTEKVTLQGWKEEEPVEIPLDPDKSAIENAKRYFSLFKKYKRDIKPLEAKRDKLVKEIAEVEEEIEMLGILEFPDEVKPLLDEIAAKKERGRRIESTPPHLTFSLPEGGRILVGLNAKGNRFVTFKAARPNDMWLHAKDIPGSHVVITGGGMSEKALLFAASLAAYYSKARLAEKVTVDYTLKKHVRAIPGSMAHVTYTDAKSLVVSPTAWKTSLEEIGAGREAGRNESS
jgi:predicted ribosome quality control (RQC) complex YloA/Tae2 family protein